MSRADPQERARERLA